jgi:branched-chain amino acid transport system ATP-binding protein
MSILKTESLTIHFGGLVALDGVDLELEAGEILGVIGPNGAGKSTFINVVSGVYLPTSGKVFFDGRDITLQPAHKRCRLGIGRTFQLIHPLTDMTVLQNIMVAALFGRGMNQRQARAEATSIGESLGLFGLDRDVSSLTVLEVKKMEIARALASRPKVLFLDEVMAGLNVEETNQLIDAVKEIRTRGMAICVVEHVMSVIRQLTDRVVVLDSGQIIAEGLYEEVSSNARVISAYLGKED